jgi:phage tail sheath gpL-like
MVSFNQIPAALRVPLFYAEVDPTMANTREAVNQRTLIISQKTSAGAAVANTPILSMGVADAITQGGPGSMLALMVDAYRQNDAVGEVWLLPLSDNGAGVNATGSVEFTAQATVAGTYVLAVGGTLVTFAVTPSMTLANLATALAAAITANTNLPVTGVVDGVTTAKVNITAKNKGTNGNDILLIPNPGGIQAGQVTPTGLAATITALSAGATNPVMTTALANLMDLQFDFIVLPYTDSTSLDALKTFLNDQTGRWSWSQQLYGHCFAAFRGTVGDATTLGLARNDQHMTILAENGSPTPSWVWAAAYTGAAAVPLKADPARPVQTIVVNGVMAPPLGSRYSLSERNTLLYSGISTFFVQDDGTVRLENLITTYQKNAFSQPDNSYLEIETMFQLMFLLRDLKAWVTSRYSRMKLASDMTRVPPGSSTVTPPMIRGDLIAHYRELAANAQAQDVDAFIEGLVVEQDGDNPNRVNVLWTGTIMNQLRIFAGLFQFRQ